MHAGLGVTRAQGGAAVGWGGAWELPPQAMSDAQQLLVCGGGGLAAVVRRWGLPWLYGGARGAATTLSTSKSGLRVH